MQQAPAPSDNQSTFTLEIYIDRATLPTVQQTAFLVAKQSSNLKLICWERHPLTNKCLLKQVNAQAFANNTLLCQHACQLLKAQQKSQVIIYANTYWSKDLAKLIRCLQAIAGVEITQLELVDDGSSEYQKMYHWQRLTNKEQSADLEAGYQNLKRYLKGGSNRFLRALSHRSHKLPRKISSMFNWHRFFPTTYHMLRMDYLDKPELQQLKMHLSGHCKQIKWDYLSSGAFSEKQQALFYKFIGVASSSATLAQTPSEFMFIGASELRASCDLQIAIIADSLKEQGVIPKHYAQDLQFKGHPHAKFNNKIAAAHQMVEMSSMIPFESLIMMDKLPKSIGGMESSLYFSLPDSYHIDYIVFSGSKRQLAENALIQIMLYLKVITQERIFFEEQFH